MAAARPTLDDLFAELRARGLRATTARRAVLAELLVAGDTHLTADELARRIHADHPAVHLSTVYRTLDALAEAGLIAVARFADQPVTYHLAGDVHHHAVCTACGATINLPAEVLAPVQRRLARDHGFVADPRHLTITGTCAACVDGAARPSPSER
jgi:Fur family ferric uptake transcriptional regulator